MTREVVFRRPAELELDAAIDWYEKKARGLGERFARAVQRTIRRIVSHPKLFVVVRADVRLAIVGEFPFTVLFREIANAIVVLAIFHTSRDPRIWMDRVDEEIP